MIEQTLQVGLVLERRTLTGAWGGIAWRPSAIFPTAPDVAAWTPLGRSTEVERFYAGEVAICLYSTDTANYRDNMESGAPKLWVVLCPTDAEPPVTVMLVTADPAEGEANTEAGTNIVETIDMPTEISAIVEAFVAAHHVERPIIKRRREGVAPDVRYRIGPKRGDGHE
jgi:Protein of unknown function (DUF3305)